MTQCGSSPQPRRFLPACLSFPWRHHALWGCVGVEVGNVFIFVRLLARAALSLWHSVLLTLPSASWQQGMNQIGSTTAWTLHWPELRAMPVAKVLVMSPAPVQGEPQPSASGLTLLVETSQYAVGQGCPL